MIYIIIVLLIIIFYCINKNIKNIENFSKIPNILYKTGPYDIPNNELQKIFDINKKKLGVGKVFYYNDNECKDFIKTMHPKINKAYNSLIPNAYKADLWRYCILYKYGGIYGDMTQKFYTNYDVNKDNVDMVLVRDINDNAIQISFIATKPNNNFMKYLINHITNDILNKKKGKNCLDFTGPQAFYRYFKLFFKINNIPEGISKLKGLDNKYYKIRIDLRQTNKLFFKNIFSKKIIASTKTKDHNNDLIRITKMPKYHVLWDKNQLFK